MLYSCADCLCVCSGVFISRGKEDALVTKNMVVGESVYGEKRMSVEVRESPPALFSSVFMLQFKETWGFHKLVLAEAWTDPDEVSTE